MITLVSAEKRKARIEVNWQSPTLDFVRKDITWSKINLNESNLVIWNKNTTFSSSVLLRKQEDASINPLPQGPLFKSATHGHSRAFCTFTSIDCTSKQQFHWYPKCHEEYHNDTRASIDYPKQKKGSYVIVILTKRHSLCALLQKNPTSVIRTLMLG
jgi:hypothetical protein